MEMTTALGFSSSEGSDAAFLISLQLADGHPTIRLIFLFYELAQHVAQQVAGRIRSNARRLTCGLLLRFSLLANYMPRTIVHILPWKSRPSRRKSSDCPTSRVLLP